MSAIFQTVPGRAVVAIETDDVQSFMIEVRDEDAGGDQAGFSNTGLTTRVEVQQQVSAQFQVSLDRAVFAVPFGDAIGQMTVGLVHGLLCDTGTGQTVDTGERILDWYRRNKFQRGRLQPLTIAIGTSIYSGYILGLSLSAESSEGSMIRSTIQLAAWGV